MTTYRLAVRPSDVLYLERECAECHRITSLPPLSTADPGNLLRTLLSACMWCNASVETPVGDTITRFLGALHAIRSLERPSVHFIICSRSSDHGAQ